LNTTVPLSKEYKETSLECEENKKTRRYKEDIKTEEYSRIKAKFNLKLYVRFLKYQEITVIIITIETNRDD